MSDLIIGRKPVLDLLNEGRSFTKLIILDTARGKEIALIKKKARVAGINYILRNINYFKSKFPELNHQGVVGYLDKEFRYSNLSVIEKFASPIFILALDHIQDPFNFGAILRSAVAFNVDSVIIPKFSAARCTAGAKKASAGAYLKIPIIRVNNLYRTLKTLKNKNFSIIIADKLGKSIKSLKQQKLKNYVLVLGSESKGISKNIKNLADNIVKVPISDKIESLNVSVAAGILMYEFKKSLTINNNSCKKFN